MPAFFERFLQRPDVQAATGGRGPFGGQVATTGAGGFVQAPEATTVRLPPMPSPRTPAGGEWGPQPSPYGPSPIRPENQRNRWAARRMAGQQMVLGGRR